MKTITLMAFFGISALIIILGLVMSWSRGAWLGFAVSLLVVAIALPRRWWQSLLVLVALTGSAAGLWLTDSLPESITERIASATEETFAFNDVRGVDITIDNYALVERLAHWQAALNMAQAHPWLGVGAGNYEIVYANFRLINWKEPLGHAHNYYLNILAEAGIIGLLGYGSLWIMILWLTWRVRRHPDSTTRLVAVGLLGSWTYLSVHSLTDNLYVNNLFIHIGLMLGILAIVYGQVYQWAKFRPPTQRTNV